MTAMACCGNTYPDGECRVHCVVQVQTETDTGERTVTETEGWEAPPGSSWRTHWVSGIAAMNETPFRMPIITPVVGELWQGGYVPGLDLGHDFTFVLSLYPWYQYPIGEGVERMEVRLYDSDDQPVLHEVKMLAEWVNDRRGHGPTLVHCQAGLNRSALIVAAALILEGWTPDDAIAHLRKQRSPAVLCNSTFEGWLRRLA